MPKWREWALPVGVLLLILYSFDQLWNGERGLVTWRLMHEQVQTLSADNAVLQKDVSHLSAVTERLKVTEDGKMDEDFLDEHIRQVLPLKKPDEMILLP